MTYKMRMYLQQIQQKSHVLNLYTSSFSFLSSFVRFSLMHNKKRKIKKFKMKLFKYINRFVVFFLVSAIYKKKKSYFSSYCYSFKFSYQKFIWTNFSHFFGFAFTTVHGLFGNDGKWWKTFMLFRMCFICVSRVIRDYFCRFFFMFFLVYLFCKGDADADFPFPHYLFVFRLYWVWMVGLVGNV